jgi:hypothetical protein
MAEKWNSSHTMAFTAGATSVLLILAIYVGLTYRPVRSISLTPKAAQLDPSRDRERMIQAIQRYARSQNSLVRMSKLRLYEPREITDNFMQLGSQGRDASKETRLLIPATYYERDNYRQVAFSFDIVAGQLMVVPALVTTSDGLSWRTPPFVSEVVNNEKPFWTSED